MDERGEYKNLVPKLSKTYVNKERTIIKNVTKVTKEKGSGKFLKKPKVHIQSISPVKVLTGGMGHHALVREGRTGYFNEEYNEDIKWLEK